MKWLVLVAFVTACTEPHSSSQTEFTDRTCSNCHTVKLQHSDTAFPISTGPHSSVACADCHVFKKGMGLNGLHCECGGPCHTMSDMAATHTGSAGTNYMWDPMNADFCLTCHPTGTGPASPP